MKKFLIGFVGLSLILGWFAGCGQGSEKDRFVAASVEVGCAMYEDPAFFEDFSLVEQKTIEIFEEYGFDATSEEEMLALEIYQEDEEVIKAVQEGITGCAGDIFGDLMLDEE